MRTFPSLFLLSICSFVFMSFNPFEPLMTLKERELKGPVKTVTNDAVSWGSSIVVEVFNKKGKLIELKGFGRDFSDTNELIKKQKDSICADIDTAFTGYKFEYRTYCYYSKIDKIDSILCFYGNEKLTNKKNYCYNKFDDLVKVIWYKYDLVENIDSTFLEFYEYTLDEKKYIKTIDSWSDTSMFICYQQKYKNKLLTIYEEYYNGKLSSVVKIFKKYNRHGDLIFEEEVQSIDYSSPEQKVSFKKLKYNKKKLLKKKLDLNYETKFFYLKDGTLEKSISRYIGADDLFKDNEFIITLYDLQGNIIERSYTYNGKPEKYIYKYQYDFYGNWTDCEEYSNDVLQNKKSRKFVYYE